MAVKSVTHVPMWKRKARAHKRRVAKKEVNISKAIQKALDKANAQQEKIRLTNKSYKHHNDPKVTEEMVAGFGWKGKK